MNLNDGKTRSSKHSFVTRNHGQSRRDSGCPTLPHIGKGRLCKRGFRTINYYEVTVASRYTGPASNIIPPIMGMIFLSPMNDLFFISYIGNSRSLPITKKNYSPLISVTVGFDCIAKQSMIYVCPLHSPIVSITVRINIAIGHKHDQVH